MAEDVRRYAPQGSITQNYRLQAKRFHMPSHRPPQSKSGRRPPKKKGGKRSPKQPDSLAQDLIARMETCQTAETLNDQVIRPFVQALVSVCDARGYVFNIYGDHCNLAITPENHAESLYQLIESYLDEANL